MPRTRPAAALAVALAAALAGAGCRSARPAPVAAQTAPALPASPRLAEGVNAVAFVAAPRSLVHSLAVTRDPAALSRSASAGVTSLRAACAPAAAPAGAVATFCGRVGDELDALAQAAAADDDERLRLAARAVVEVMLAELGLAPGRTADAFLRVEVARSFLARMGSDARWRELRNAPAPSLSREIVATADALADACTGASPPAGWDCARAREPLEALRAAGEAGALDERTRALARDVLAALSRPAGR